MKKQQKDDDASLKLPSVPSGECADTSQPRRLLIIGMSANSDSETRRLATEAGMDHFLEKPFVLADFMKLLAQLQQQSHSRCSVSACASVASTTPLSASLNGENGGWTVSTGI
jgi:DNA-binding response OmpR family regulator